MLPKLLTSNNYRASSLRNAQLVHQSCAGQCHKRLVGAAAFPSPLVMNSVTEPACTYKNREQPAKIFLSRSECLDVLNRITDSCLSSSFPSSAAVYGAEADETDLMSQVLDVLYDDAEEVFMSKRGYVIPRREAALVESTGGSPTFGEITGAGVTQFLRNVPLQPDDVLVDLGSGLGRFVLQVACSTRLRRCVGIELSASRHEQACWVATRLARLDDDDDVADPRVSDMMSDGGSSGETGSTFVLRPAGGAANAPQQLQPQGTAAAVAVAEEAAAAQRGGGGGLLLSPVELRCDDLTATDLADGSAFFLCSTAFSFAACRAIAERLARHHRFRLLVTSRALPFPSPLTQLGQFPCSFSWTAAGTAYVYVRSLAEAPGGLLAAYLTAPQGTAGDVGAEAEGVTGGVAWIPSACTVALVPGDLMVKNHGTEPIRSCASSMWSVLDDAI